MVEISEPILIGTIAAAQSSLIITGLKGFLEVSDDPGTESTALIQTQVKLSGFDISRSESDD